MEARVKPTENLERQFELAKMIDDGSFHDLANNPEELWELTHLILEFQEWLRRSGKVMFFHEDKYPQ